MASESRQESIVAPATPSGVSALAVVRLSGPAVREIAATQFGAADLVPRQMRLVEWRSPKSSQTMEQLLIAFFPAPHSFTGEDLLELYPHGNPLLVQLLLSAIAAHPGCRLAQPGEFTRRAYENGKIDLTQAEAIDAAIHARTPEGLQLARRLATGKLSNAVQQLVDQLTHLSAQVELEMDFAEEEVAPQMERWPAAIDQLRQTIAQLLQGWEQTQRALRLPKVVLYGAPNAGKSSLANALLGDERLLVSNHPGTTRDWVEAQLTLPTGELTLCDTAGLGTAQDELDSAAQAQTLQLLEAADIALWVEDGRYPTTAPAPLSREIPILKVRTRADQPQFFDEPNSFAIDCKKGEGLLPLRTALQKALELRPPLSDNALVASQRQADALRSADSSLQEAAQLLRLQQRTTPELVAFALQAGRNALQSITGTIATDQLLQSIFSRFCIGK